MKSIGAELRKRGRVWLDEAEPEAAAMLGQGMSNAGDALSSGVRQAASFATGRLAASVQTYGGGLARGVRMAAPYAIPADLGSRAHAAPLAPLVQWAEAKLGLSGPQAMAVAVAVSKIQMGDTPEARTARVTGKPERKPTKRQLARRALTPPRIRRKEFFYSTFRRLRADLLALHIGPVAPQIVAALNR